MKIAERVVLGNLIYPALCGVYDVKGGVRGLVISVLSVSDGTREKIKMFFILCKL